MSIKGEFPKFKKMDNGKTQTPMTKSDASRIQSTQETSGKDTGSGSFASRAQAAGNRNANANQGKGN